MVFNQKACSALPSCSMRWTSIYKKNLFFPRGSAEKGPPYKEYLLSVKQHITDWLGKRMSAPCSQHVHPCLVWGKAVPVLTSTLQKGAAASS